MRGSPRPPNAGKGRPKGAKNKGNAEVRALAQLYTAEAIRRLVSLMRSKKTAKLTQFYAAQKLLNRGHGRPGQAVTGEGGKRPARIELTIVDELYPNG
jgi:hypothetical protein